MRVIPISLDSKLRKNSRPTNSQQGRQAIIPMRLQAYIDQLESGPAAQSSDSIVDLLHGAIGNGRSVATSGTA